MGEFLVVKPFRKQTQDIVVKHKRTGVKNSHMSRLSFFSITYFFHLLLKNPTLAGNVIKLVRHCEGA